MSGPAGPPGPGIRKGYRRRLAVGAWVLAGLCVLGGLGWVLMLTYGLRYPGEGRQQCCWEQNATPDWAATVTGLRVPDTAVDRRAGLHTNMQYDAVLLAFTVRTEEADRFLDPLRRQGTGMARNRHPEQPGHARGDGFAHLGLPEPETLVEGMRVTSVCPHDAQTPESDALRMCAKIHAYEFQPGTTRVYIRAESDANIEKPPS
ncbi:hypothetical protein WDV06_28400 [Streptomyces racemochromogenes]|uniref:Uncharacterized protein n=1 Tax=Streptomyces racemochromogenes TaxID=67353 RepID=A0ABW7PKQ2_9ACTN